MVIELDTIICADCLEVLKSMPDKSVDLVLTDPPYGIARIWDGSDCGGWKGRKSEEHQTRNAWDIAPSQEYFDQILRVGKTVCIWGGNYFQLPVSRGWLIWRKPLFPTMSDAELAWTNVDTVMRVFDGARSDPDRVHPTQKPLELMKWCMTKLSKEGDTILDPFAGSGTTCVAAKILGRKYIGIEISPVYAEIARKRVAQAQYEERLF
jgi:DNA modification methylase